MVQMMMIAFLAAAFTPQVLANDCAPNEPVRLNDERPKLSVFPNPNSGDVLSLVIENLLPEKHRSIEVTITNRAGETVFRDRFQNEEKRFAERLDLNDLPRGLYTVKVVLDRIVLTERLAVR